MTSNLHIASDGYDAEVLRTGDDTATLRLVGPDRDAHTIELSGIRVEPENMRMTAQAAVMFLNPTVEVRVWGSHLTVSINHSWFADGDHEFILTQEQLASARAFLQGFVR